MSDDKIYKYYEALNKSDETVILIEGAGINPLLSEDLALKLQKFFNVILFDTPGFGKYLDEKPLFSVHDLANKFNAELEKMNLNNYHIIGHCMGGGVAQIMALTKPKNVNKLVLVSTSAGSYQRLITQEYLTYVKQFYKLSHYMFAEDFIKNNPAFVSEFNEKVKMCRLERNELVSHCFAAFSFSTIKESSSIKAKTLVIHGDKDLTMDIKFGQKLAKSIPNARFLKLADVGHSPFIEKPEVIDDVISFLKNNKDIGEDITTEEPYSKYELADDAWFREYLKTKDFARRVQKMYNALNDDIINEAINNIK